MSKKRKGNMGRSDLERKVFHNARKIINEVNDPQERLSKLLKQKRGIKKMWPATDRWDGFAEDLIETGIEQAQHEIDRSQKKEKQVDVQKLIHEFAGYYTESERVEYSQKAIATYITHWQRREGVKKRRAKAKSAAKEECQELRQINSDGTFINWEENWTEFLKSRTKK